MIQMFIKAYQKINSRTKTVGDALDTITVLKCDNAHVFTHLLPWFVSPRITCPVY